MKEILKNLKNEEKRDIKMIKYKVTQITKPIKDIFLDGKNPLPVLKKVVSDNILYEVENTKTKRKWIYIIKCYHPYPIVDSSKIEECEWEKHKRIVIEKYDPNKILDKLREDE